MGLSQIISKETRRGGENGPVLGDKDPDGEAEAGKGLSPESQDPNACFCSFKRFLFCSFPPCPGAFCDLLSLFSYSRPFRQTGLTKSVCPELGWRVPKGSLSKMKILKAWFTSCK